MVSFYSICLEGPVVTELLPLHPRRPSQSQKQQQQQNQQNQHPRRHLQQQQRLLLLLHLLDNNSLAPAHSPVQSPMPPRSHHSSGRARALVLTAAERGAAGNAGRVVSLKGGSCASLTAAGTGPQRGRKLSCHRSWTGSLPTSPSKRFARE